MMMSVQLNLLEASPPAVPAGFEYRDELLSPVEETALLALVAELPFREFEFHGYFGKRRTVSYGLRYDFATQRANRAEPIPQFLLPLRERASSFAGIVLEALEHALITEYTEGA